MTGYPSQNDATPPSRPSGRGGSADPSCETSAKTGKRRAPRDKAPARPVDAAALAAEDDLDGFDALDGFGGFGDFDDIPAAPVRRKPTAKSSAKSSAKKRKLHWSFLVAGLAVIGAIVYLVVANTGATAEYYMTINELRTCTACQSQNVRVLGNVAPNSVSTNTATQVVHFTITQGAQSLPVVYGGIVPDTFKSGLQVVVEGHMVNGVFQAQTLLAKCPSRFQAAPTQTGR